MTTFADHKTIYCMTGQIYFFEFQSSDLIILSVQFFFKEFISNFLTQAEYVWKINDEMKML